jgi:hypothetical protein
MVCLCANLSHFPKGLVTIAGSSSFLPEKLYSPPVNLNIGKLRKRRLSCIHTLGLFREFVLLLDYSMVVFVLYTDPLVPANEVTDEFLFALFWKSSGAHRDIDRICKKLRRVESASRLDKLRDDTWPNNPIADLRELHNKEYMQVLALFATVNFDAGIVCKTDTYSHSEGSAVLA